MKKIMIAASMVLLLLAPLVFNGCGSKTDNEEGFAVYLTRDNIPVNRMEMQSHLDIAGTPVISKDDIKYYVKDTHEIELTTKAWGRLNTMSVPTTGISFAVCVNKSPVYWGAFWPPYSSQSFDGVTILLPSMSVTENRIKIELGYPSSSFFKGEDPRSNPGIIEALEKAGKLK